MRLYPVPAVALAFAIVIAIGTSALAQSPAEQTVQTATNVLNEIMAAPVTSIPQNLLADAQGLAIIPGMLKGGFVIGVRHGRGVALVRDQQGAWRPPVFVSMTGGSIGWQAGLQATDVILVFRTPKSVQGLLNGKFTIGADAAAAAGPVGRQASAATDAQLRAEILSYSRSRGLFAGISLDGSMLQIDHATTQAYYQLGGMIPGAGGWPTPGTLPPSAVQLLDAVARHTGRTPIAQDVNLAQPATLPPVNVLASPGPSEPELRAQLATASQRLQGLLDEQWKGFLAVPPGIHQGTQPPDVESLRQTAARFDTVATDAQFAALAQRPEFQTVHQLLRGYLNARTAATTSPLTLPPPPNPGGAPSSPSEPLFR